MTQPESPAAPDGFTYIVRQALFTLTPFFMDGANGDPANARAAARELLSSYKTNSAEELQLAAECVAFAYAAMDNLRKAQADPEIQGNRRLRFGNGAALLNQVSQRSRRSLDDLRKTHPPAPREPPFPPGLAHLPVNPAAILQEVQQKLAAHFERMEAARTHPDAAPPATVAVVPLPSVNPTHRRSAEPAARRTAQRAQG